MQVNLKIKDLNTRKAQEIANALGMSIYAVKKHYHSGMTKILRFYHLNDDKRDELAYLLFRLTTEHYLQNEDENG